MKRISGQGHQQREGIPVKKRFSDEQNISILREAEAGMSARELCCKHAISDATVYTIEVAVRLWSVWIASMANLILI
jgi:Mor family transcriptional regulator